MQDKAISVRENWALLGYYAGGCDISYRRFGKHLSGSIFKVQTLEDGIDRWPLKKGPMDCSETSVRNYHYMLR